MQVVLKPSNRSLMFDPTRIQTYIERISEDHPHLDSEKLYNAVMTKLKNEEILAADIITTIYMTAMEFVTIEEPDWTFVAAQALCTKMYKEAALNRGYKAYPTKPYGSFYKLLQHLTDKNIYKPHLLTQYSQEQIAELEDEIDYTRDKLYTYPGLLTFAERYLTKDFDGKTMELPQERNMVIAMELMINEMPEERLALVKEVYWAISNLYMTTATPTMSNAGKARGGQLSSCFIDTIDDSLRSIYDTNTDAARLSKMGGGIGMYIGKVRPRGAMIRGYSGKSSGIVPWIRQLNNTAVSVDQLGTRKGSIAVYLDVWHKDILAFLDLKLNNGDERLRAHDIFPGVCIPDLFMEAVTNRSDWHLFDPHEVRDTMGWSLEDFYDEEKGNGSFRTRFQQCIDHPTLTRITVPAIDIIVRIMKSQLETGTPYMFYRDTVNRANPNKAHGIIYSSNLCTEIMQNMSPTAVSEETLVEENGETLIVTKRKPGDFVVCNLSSIHLGRAVTDSMLERLIPIQMRMLDNVIDINKIEVLQAQYTNKRYRAVGLGTFGLHHIMALKGIMWESDEAVEFNDHLYEYICYLAIKASMQLAQEKGAYPLFEGSEWASGAYFDDREYTARTDNQEHKQGTREGKYVTREMWEQLKREVMTHGVRNGYISAVAPNGSTSIIAGSTASIDPIYKLLSYEEKTTYKIANTAPDLNTKTMQYYRKHAFMLDQHASIRMGAARQRHIDQGQSFNLYVQPDIKAKDFLDLHIGAWANGLKATYYVRSQALSIEECESCSS